MIKISQNNLKFLNENQILKVNIPLTSKRNLTFNLLDPDQIRLTLCYTDYFYIFITICIIICKIGVLLYVKLEIIIININICIIMCKIGV